jgi:hypothetical protein
MSAATLTEKGQIVIPADIRGTVGFRVAVIRFLWEGARNEDQEPVRRRAPTHQQRRLPFKVARMPPTVGSWVLKHPSRRSLSWRKVPKDSRDKDQRRHVTNKVSVFMLIAHSLNRHDCGMDEARPHCE